MSLFTEEGMRKGTKSTLYSAFQPVNLDEKQGRTKFVVVDGGHLLHKVVWPRSSSFGSIADRYTQYITAQYGSNVAVVFDGYPTAAAQKGTKSSERLRRAKSHPSSEIIFHEETMAQVSQENFLSNDKNKIRFINLLKTKMGNHNIPVLQAEEDADRLIITTAVTIASSYDLVLVAGEDIDLLIILTGISHGREIFFKKCGRSKAADVIYSSTISSRYTSKPELFLFIHAFSGCDSTSCFFGQGKMKILSIFQKNPNLVKETALFLGTTSTPDEIAAAGERITVVLYGGNPDTQNLDQLRYHLFVRAAAKTNFNLARLPPTRDAARFHSLRTYHQLSLGVEDGILQAYNMDFELQFSHKVSQMTRFSQADIDGCTFLYLLRDDGDNLFYCYLFQAQKVKDVTELYKQMKEQSHVTPTRSLSSAATLTSLCVDISPSSSNFFEVLYIGKIKVWQKKVPDSFIDDALEKFRIHELEKNKLRQLETIGRLQSEDNLLRRGSTDSAISENSPVESPSSIPAPPIQRSISFQSNIVQKQVNTVKAFEKEVNSEKLKSIGAVTDENGNKEIKEESSTPASGASSSSENEPAQKESPPQVRELKSSVNMDDHNRTMVLQVDRTDLRLISPDRKVILLHKHHRDITTCLQALIRPEHFGFICKENNNEIHTFMGYIFKCESASIASDAVAAITQAFLTSEPKTRPLITSCEHCPMIWFHKLCTEIEHLSDKKTQAAILKRLEQLDSDEQLTILTKFRGAETDSVREQNEFLMMLLRAHCETKQGRHIHDTAENRSEFLNQYLGVGGTNVFSKAKKSLTNSFDQFLKRRISSNDFTPNMRQMSLPITNNYLNKESSPSASIQTPISESSNSDKESEGFRSRSSTIDSQHEEHDNYLSVKNAKQSSVSPDRSTAGSDKGLKSPMMDIFIKVGNCPKTTTSEDDPHKLDTGSWRQAIFKRVTATKKDETLHEPRRKKTREELRELWKKSIKQAILLIRMEKENARLKAQQEEHAVKRIKLEYDEMKPSQREVMEVWEMLTNKESNIKCDKPMLLQAIRQGVPRGKRGEVWQFLAEQHCLKSAPPDPNKYPYYNVPYEQLLHQLTSHQHAILIDLGRTFPNHSYFSSPLGPGQLALFNLLKAYSLLDPEVGYCQGLSFVAGVLLLHMEEAKAFFLLRHLMFRRAMRIQYLPDMVGLQIKLYQLSRLLHDHIPELYSHLDFYEVAPTLYAAPWMLTMFASQFPLGFVTRVFDLVFLEGPDVIFRVAIALLNFHKDKILACDSFEEIMNFLKGPLATVDKPTLDKVMKEIYTTDIKKQLDEYKVEYQVLQEEMVSVQPQVEALHKFEAQNKILAEQNKALMGQLELAMANVQRLEKTRVLQQAQLNRLEMQSRGLDVTIAALGNFINNLIEEKVDIEIPDEVRRIMSQITLSEKKKNEAKGQNNLLKMLQEKENRMQPPDRIMVKSLSTGRISLPTTLEVMARTNSLNTKAENILTPELKNQVQTSPCGSTEKKSHFFSNSHSNILEQQRLHNGQNSMLNNKIDIKIQEFENSRKHSVTSSIDIPTVDKNVSPTHSIDSGVGTPLSPRIPENHPLSNCDVNFTFSGTKELKHLKTLKHYQRNSSPDMLGDKS